MPLQYKESLVYDESKIITLSSLEHIRLRTGMYIGRLGDGSSFDDGIYILLKEVIDNSVDEFIMGYGKCIELRLEGKKISVRDYGRGIPLGKLLECVSVINTGAKYNDDVFQFSVGLNGVGTKAVNALSSYFKVTSFREGQWASVEFSKGKLISENAGKRSKEKNGTLVEFVPDEEVFGEYTYNQEFIEKRLWTYAYLNKGLTLDFNGKEFSSERGLEDLLASEIGEQNLYDPIYVSKTALEFAFTHTENYGESYFSFVNGQPTVDGGTHLSAFREGVLKGICEYYQKSFNGSDVREGFAGAIAIKLKNPIFESQTKNKLGNTEIRPWIISEVRSAVVDALHRNKKIAKVLETKILQNEALRKELTLVQKEAKEAAKKIALKIPNLKDCKYHLGEDGAEGEKSMIFLTEGQSASGSMVSARDVYHQAIFSLRGKPQNMYGRRRTAIYQNEELYNLMVALGIEHS
ncbi:MAG: ATP-binding protein, partial [Spirochaetales bacterium]